MYTVATFFKFNFSEMVQAETNETSNRLYFIIYTFFTNHITCMTYFVYIRIILLEAIDVK